MSGITDAGTPEMEQPKADDSKNREEEYNTLQASHKSLQADHTRKSQRAAELEKEKLANGDEESDEDKAMKERLDKKGYANVEALEKFQKQTENEMGFRDLLSYYPGLGTHEKAIRELQKTNGGTFEEVAINYGFTTTNKLEKARQGRGKMVGTDRQEQKTSLEDMSSTEFDKWKRENASKNGSLERVTGI